MTVILNSSVGSNDSIKFDIRHDVGFFTWTVCPCNYRVCYLESKVELMKQLNIFFIFRLCFRW